MTPQEAADLAARTLAAIPPGTYGSPFSGVDILAADRERVASDLSGIEEHQPSSSSQCDCGDDAAACSDAARYVAGLVRTAALYGVTP